MRTLIFVCIACWVMSCVKSKDYSDIPSLEFRSFSKTSMHQGNLQEDSVILTLYFTDGDGDFGLATGQLQSNVFIKDLRTNQLLSQYKAPFVPLEGAGNGISGLIKIKVYTTCCIFAEDTGIFPCTESDEFPTNSLPIEIYIKDRAGNMSNVVKVETLMLDCR